MLVEFRVANFLSIQDEQVLSLVANSDKTHRDSHSFSLMDAKITLLKSAVIYGPNAAGKSSLIKAMIAMREIVRRSSNYQRGMKLPVTPFLLGNAENNESSIFEITVFVNNVRYQYGFSVTKERICDEWLIVYPQNRAQKWFERKYDSDKQDHSWYFGASFKGAKEQWKDLTRDNALFLSTAIQFNSVQLQPLFDWFLKCQISSPNGWENATIITALMCKNNDTDKTQILDYLRAADFDIEDIGIEDRKMTFTDLPKDMPDQLKAKILNDNARLLDVYFYHSSQDGRNVRLKKSDESDGTQRFFDFIGPFIDILKKGSVVFVDELHNHFHPLMTQFLVRLFHDKTINKNNAQLIFTTHETSILSQDVFRRDQIWFCEKQNKATRLYPLSDFKVRKDNSLERSYFLGQFGALPYFSDISKAMGL